MKKQDIFLQKRFADESDSSWLQRKHAFILSLYMLVMFRIAAQIISWMNLTPRRLIQYIIVNILRTQRACYRHRPFYYFLCLQIFSNRKLCTGIKWSFAVIFRNRGAHSVVRSHDLYASTLHKQQDYYVPSTRLNSSDSHLLLYFSKLWNNFVHKTQSDGVYRKKRCF